MANIKPLIKPFTICIKCTFFKSFFQFFFSRWGKGVIWANAGGEEAAKIVRRTFAVLIKHSKLISDFQCLCDDIEFEEESAEVIYLSS